MPKKKQSFEESLSQLEKVVDKMESGDVPLDKCLDLYEKGVKLADACAAELSEAEKRIEKLHKKNEEKFETTPFDDEPEEETTDSNVPF